MKSRQQSAIGHLDGVVRELIASIVVEGAGDGKTARGDLDAQVVRVTLAIRQVARERLLERALFCWQRRLGQDAVEEVVDAIFDHVLLERLRQADTRAELAVASGPAEAGSALGARRTGRPFTFLWQCVRRDCHDLARRREREERLAERDVAASREEPEPGSGFEEVAAGAIVLRRLLVRQSALSPFDQVLFERRWCEGLSYREIWQREPGLRLGLRGSARRRSAGRPSSRDLKRFEARLRQRVARGLHLLRDLLRSELRRGRPTRAARVTSDLCLKMLLDDVMPRALVARVRRIEPALVEEAFGVGRDEVCEADVLELLGRTFAALARALRDDVRGGAPEQPSAPLAGSTVRRDHLDSHRFESDAHASSAAASSGRSAGADLAPVASARRQRSPLRIDLMHRYLSIAHAPADEREAAYRALLEALEASAPCQRALVRELVGDDLSPSDERRRRLVPELPCITRKVVTSLFEVPLFEDLPPATRAALEQAAEERRYGRGDYLAVQGAEGRCLFAPLAGRIAVLDESAGVAARSLLEVRRPGEVVAEMGVITPRHQRTATLLALDDLRVLAVGYEPLRRLLTDPRHHVLRDRFVDLFFRRRVQHRLRQLPALRDAGPREIARLVSDARLAAGRMVTPAQVTPRGPQREFVLGDVWSSTGGRLRFDRHTQELPVGGPGGDVYLVLDGTVEKRPRHVRPGGAVPESVTVSAQMPALVGWDDGEPGTDDSAPLVVRATGRCWVARFARRELEAVMGRRRE